MRNLGFGSYFAANKPALSEDNKKKRLRWVKEHDNWTEKQWRGVVWSDESHFTVEGNDGEARVIRKVCKRYTEKSNRVIAFGYE